MFWEHVHTPEPAAKPAVGGLAVSPNGDVLVVGTTVAKDGKSTGTALLVDKDGKQKWVQQLANGSVPKQLGGVIRLPDGRWLAVGTLGTGNSVGEVIVLDQTGNAAQSAAYSNNNGGVQLTAIEHVDATTKLVTGRSNPSGQLWRTFVAAVDGNGKKQWDKTDSGGTNDTGVAIAKGGTGVVAVIAQRPVTDGQDKFDQPRLLTFGPTGAQLVGISPQFATKHRRPRDIVYRASDKSWIIVGTEVDADTSSRQFVKAYTVAGADRYFTYVSDASGSAYSGEAGALVLAGDGGFVFGGLLAKTNSTTDGLLVGTDGTINRRWNAAVGASAQDWNRVQALEMTATGLVYAGVRVDESGLGAFVVGHRDAFGNATCTASKACVGVQQKDCDDGKACTVDTCAPASGCVHNAAQTGTVCNFNEGTCSGLGVCPGE